MPAATAQSMHTKPLNVGMRCWRIFYPTTYILQLRECPHAVLLASLTIIRPCVCRQAGETALPGGRPRRILVEGEPGFGKSTLTLKLLHDWACDDAPQYLRYFQVSEYSNYV